MKCDLLLGSLLRITDVAGKNYCAKNKSQVRTRKYSAIMWCKVSNTNPLVDTITSYKNKWNKQLSTTGKVLFWNYVNWIDDLFKYLWYEDSLVYFSLGSQLLAMQPLKIAM